MKYYQTLCIYVALILIVSLGNATAQITDSGIINDIKENVAIETDRDVFFSGENIYFSVSYNLNNSDVNNAISKIVYIELISCSNGSVYVQKKYSLSDYSSNGFLTIPKDVVTGNYLLRAYTHYQRNFSYLDFGYQFITILNPKNNTTTLSNWQETDSIWIVPEGNIIIDNIKNKVIIRIPDSLAIQNNKFYITDNDNNRTELGQPSEYGFIETEQLFNSSNKYNLLIETYKGESILTPFPGVLSSGIQTSINTTGNSINYIIQTKGMVLQNQNYKVNVFTNDFRKKYTKDIAIANPVNYLNIDQGVFETGMNYIVLEKPDGSIESINTLYHIIGKTNDISIILDSDKLKSRQNVSFEIVPAKAINDKSFVLSASVTKKGARLINERFKPSFYLTHSLLVDNYVKGTSLLDQKLLSQIMILFDKTLNKESFYQRIDLAEKKKIEYFPETRGLTISGILQNKTTKEPIANHDVYLSVLYNNPQLHIYRTKENGEFVFSLSQLTGINDVFISPITDMGDDYELLVKSSFSPDKPDLKSVPALFNLADKQNFEEIFVNYQLQQKFCETLEVHDKNRVKSQQFNIDENKSTFYMKDYILFESFEEIFLEIIPNAKINKSGGQLNFNVYDKNSIMLPGKPLVLVDYLPVFDFNKLLKMHVSQIEKIEVVGNTYILGPNIINGVILITTNSENFGEIDFP